ncbi:MAG: histidine phosphatase family protein [Clostridia bacterium]|jgi:broad specificity phosphatase PhoE|nr:histidine phosphatase family protein [Clostridia bacterium]
MIYIVRHGQTNWNLEGRNQGRIDIELNEKGIQQAELTSEKLENIKFDKVFSSPLKRAYKTAQVICEKIGIDENEIIVDERIIERCNGELEGLLREEYEGKVDFSDPNDTRYGVESLTGFRIRIDEFFKEICNKYKDRNVLVVTHAGVSIYAKCFFEGEPDDGDYNKYKLKNCEVLEYKNDK